MSQLNDTNSMGRAFFRVEQKSRLLVIAVKTTQNDSKHREMGRGLEKGTPEVHWKVVLLSGCPKVWAGRPSE